VEKVLKSEPAQTGVWVGVATITMSFAAFTSAMVVRQGAAPDSQYFHLPSILYFNTLILIVSSLTLEQARRRIAAVSGLQGTAPAVHLEVVPHPQAVLWLYVTLALGLIFLCGQILAWLRLAAEGLFLATSPNSSFFYVLTALHGLHLLGGVAGLTYVLRRVSRSADPGARNALGAATIYWHFMDLLWIYLLLILTIRA
jgi:cytochrome c oxidase subunit 3